MSPPNNFALTLDGEVMPTEPPVAPLPIHEGADHVGPGRNVRDGEAGAEAATIHVLDRGEQQDWSSPDRVRVGNLGRWDTRVPPAPARRSDGANLPSSPRNVVPSAPTRSPGRPEVISR